MGGFKMKLDKVKICLVVLLLLVILFSVIKVIGMKSPNNYTTLTEHAYVGEMFEEKVVSDKGIDYKSNVNAREHLTGGPYYFGENIKVGDVYIQIEKQGFVKGFQDI